VGSYFQSKFLWQVPSTQAGGEGEDTNEAENNLQGGDVELPTEEEKA